MDNIEQHIQKNQDILSDPLISPQSRRHVDEELEALEVYKNNHPDDDHDPTSLELYCDSHPDDSACKIFDN